MAAGTFGTAIPPSSGRGCTRNTHTPQKGLAMSASPQTTPVSAVPTRTGWFAAVIVGSILALLGGTLLGAAGVAGAAIARSDDGQLTTRPAALATDAYAVTTSPISLTALPDRDIRISLTAGSEGDKPVFIGIGTSADVADYLADVHVAELTGMAGPARDIRTRDIPGSAQPASPVEQTFWVASGSGAGARSLSWVVEPGDWTMVIMNADASAGIDTAVSAGVDAPWLAPIAVALIAVAITLFILGLALIIVGVFMWGRGRTPASVPGVGPYPAALTGELRAAPSRALWLVKWILVIPHWIVLALLWVAFLVTTVVAGFAILFTGRYPKAIFEFNVGVLRWSWRVSFYAYSALATDQYPPFSLEQHPDYPATFDVAYPERLSHGLVLVKSWLLAIPHLLVVAVLTGTAWGIGSWSGSANSVGTGISLLVLLVIVAAVILLFTGRYQQPLFDLIMGINRWAFRVTTYVALMRDEYPPFRLDQGGTEPEVDATASPHVTD